jgi:hypothetical protein
MVKADQDITSHATAKDYSVNTHDITQESLSKEDEKLFH